MFLNLLQDVIPALSNSLRTQIGIAAIGSINHTL